jgi:hypothetical protein
MTGFAVSIWALEKIGDLSDFCAIGRISSERNPFFSELNGGLVKRQTPMLNRYGPFL